MVDSLSKSYGAVAAVTDVSFTIERGEVTVRELVRLCAGLYPRHYEPDDIVTTAGHHALTRSAGRRYALSSSPHRS
ncbi:MAG TPA: hypothetical protein VNF47_19225 [Streptosporangiaceae bacterium]|nr:hypothetical protein [Streptosporangiaceae bacterium]